MTLAVSIIGDSHIAETWRRAMTFVPGVKISNDAKATEIIFVAQDVYNHDSVTELGAVGDTLELLMIETLPDKLVVLLSQVPPGFTRKWTKGDTTPGLTQLYYMVDTIIVKQSIERVRHPEQIIIGALDPNAPLPLALQEFILLVGEPPVSVMSYESAELAKLAINYSLYAQIKLARFLEQVSGVVGARYDDVRKALHNDRRIGPHAYLHPGEPNIHLNRDVYTITRLFGEIPDYGHPDKPASEPAEDKA